MKKKKTKDIVYYLLLTFFAAVFIVSGTLLARNLLTSRKQDKELENLVSEFPEDAFPVLSLDEVHSGIDDSSTAGTGTDNEETQAAESSQSGSSDEDAAREEFWSQVSSGEWKQYWDTVAENRFDTYRNLKAQNPDFVGWIHIEGTRIDYPVVQSVYEADYYLRRDFNKNNSSYGIPYMMEHCRTEEPETNLLIYGHHMRNGAMFAALQNYTRKSYFNQHPYIQFDTMDRAGTYQIVGALKIDAAGDQSMWQNLLFPRSMEDFEQAWGSFQQQTFYSTGVSITQQDHLLALVTCEYTLKDGRLMVLAREVS